MDLSQYKNKFQGKKIVLFASGPSLNYFDKTMIPPNYMRACVNGVIIHKEYQDVDLYFWAGDLDAPKHPTPSEKPIRENLKHLKQNCLKFTNTTINKKSRHPMWGQTQILESDARNLGFTTYDINFGKGHEHPQHTWNVDLNKGLDGCSITLAACQLLLHMGFDEIVLVGCDCTTRHSYAHLVNNDKCDWKLNQLVERWIRFKNFVDKFYKTKFYIINPIGLKNVFSEYSK